MCKWKINSLLFWLLLVLLTVIPLATSLAAEGDFVIDENGVLTKYNGWQRYVVIPEGVTAIGNNAFKNNDKIVRVTMTDNVKSIGDQAFYDCDNLYVCELSNNLESIGYNAFYSCDSLSSVVMPDTVNYLGGWAY